MQNLYHKSIVEPFESNFFLFMTSNYALLVQKLRLDLCFIYLHIILKSLAASRLFHLVKLEVFSSSIIVDTILWLSTGTTYFCYVYKV